MCVVEEGSGSNRSLSVHRTLRCECRKTFTDCRGGSAKIRGEGARLLPGPTINYLASEHRKSLPGLAPVALPFSNVTSPLHIIQRYPVGRCTSRVLLSGGISFATS